MQTAKLFINGSSQAVRLPREFRFPGDKVGIRRIGNSVILFPVEQMWETFLEGLNGFTNDFLADGRGRQLEQKRDSL